MRDFGRRPVFSPTCRFGQHNPQWETILYYLLKSWWPHPAELSSLRRREHTVQSWDPWRTSPSGAMIRDLSGHSYAAKGKCKAHSVPPPMENTSVMICFAISQCPHPAEPTSAMALAGSTQT